MDGWVLDQTLLKPLLSGQNVPLKVQGPGVVKSVK